MRGPKKSETLEVRLPFALKQAFMARCRADGVTASEAVRGFIEARLATPRRPPKALRWAAAAAAAAVLGAVAAPSLARPGVQAQFARLDVDRDGQISFAEFDRAALLQVTAGPDLRAAVPPSPARERLVRDAFARLDADGDGVLSLSELRHAR